MMLQRDSGDDDVLLSGTGKRSEAIEQFLSSVNVDRAESGIRQIAGDASFRKYFRLNVDAASRILMDAPPEHEDIVPFLRVDQWLLQEGFSAPVVYEENRDNGFILLEDLGDDLFSRVLTANVDQENTLYRHALDVLIGLRGRRILPRSIPVYNTALYLKELDIFTEWFVQSMLPDVTAIDIAHFRSLWEALISHYLEDTSCVVLRDFHADNLLWLPDRQGVRKVGLLDFQDAVAGHPAYDLVSLLEDARRDVSQETVAQMFAYYREMVFPQDSEAWHMFCRDYAILGAQRNLKIIGIFHRLSKRDGKPDYLAYLPRVWRHLERDLAMPELSEIADWLNRHVPAEIRQ